jgi:NAD dependent epimerase/dehydratase family enzyme
VLLRTGVVLEAGTPALERLLLLARTGLGGPVGTGRQWVSWIHVEDWVRIVLCALGLEEPALPDGVVVASAPEPVRNAEMMRTLRTAVGRRIGLPTPAPVLRLGAVLLRTDPALGLTGRHATSRVLREAGFAFRHPAPALTRRGESGRAATRSAARTAPAGRASGARARCDSLSRRAPRPRASATRAPA